MFDVVMVGGTLVDGTGAPARVADIGVRDGHVAEIAPPGSLSSPGTRVIDATGLVVAPGFIDIHTHHDAQVFWDPACTPSPLHGVTTVMAGNCGFTIAPLLGESADYLMRMLSRVEGMPLEALQEGVPWNWRTTAEFLDRVAAMSPVMNMGFMVGHSAVRRSVLGSRTLDGAASDAELAIMRSLVADGLAAGGIGFSSSWSATHCDEAGDPVPSRASGPDELVALCEVVADHPGTQLEFSPTNVGFDDRHIETMIRMSAAARRPLNWSIYMPADAQREASLAKVAVADTAVARGARVQPLMYPGVLTVRASFLGAAFDSLPGWSKMLASSHADKLAALGDPLSRAELDRSARSPREDGTMHDSARWADMVVQETFAPQNKVHEGRRIGDIAAEQSRDPFDVLCDMVIADDLRTGVCRTRRAATARRGSCVSRPGAIRVCCSVHRMPVRTSTSSPRSTGAPRSSRSTVNDRCSVSNEPCIASRVRWPRPTAFATAVSSPSAPRPTSWCSTRRSSLRARCDGVRTCPVAPGGSTEKVSASSTFS
jgi:N-acyl-D-aspartate/D-glutamate deacylase